MTAQIKRLLLLMIGLLILCITKTYSQPTRSTDTCSQLSNNDKRIWNIVWSVNNQLEKESKIKDTIIIIQNNIIIQDSIKYVSKTKEADEQKVIISDLQISADKSKKVRSVLQTIVIVETTIIILKLIL